MKKMVVLCVTPFILAAIFIVCILCLPTRLSYPFINEKGNVNVLKNVAFNATVITGNQYQSSGSLKIDFHNQDGNASHTFTYHTNIDKINDNKYYATLTSNISNAQNQMAVNYEDMEKAHSELNAEWNTESQGDGCSVNEEAIERLPLNYKMILMKNNTSYYIGNSNASNIFTLASGLSLTNMENMKLYNSIVSCENNEDTYENYYYDGQSDSVDMDIKGATKDDKNFYFMIPTDAFVEGQNKIYKVTIEEPKEDDFAYRAETSDVVNLPMDRYYKKMIMIEKQLYVIAYTQNALMMMTYDMEGDLLQEITTENQNEKIQNIISYKDYIMMETDDHFLVYQSSTNSFVDIIKKTKDMQDKDIQDMMYQNQTLYILEAGKGYESKTNDKYEVINSRNIVEVRIRAIKNGKQLYTGVQKVYDSKQVDGIQKQNMYLYEAKFVRDDI